MRNVRRLGALVPVLAEEGRADPLVLDSIAVPVLLIWGRRDQLCSIDGAQALLDVVPGSRLVAFDGVGHCPQVQRPADIAELLVGWPTGTRRAASTPRTRERRA